MWHKEVSLILQCFDFKNSKFLPYCCFIHRKQTCESGCNILPYFEGKDKEGGHAVITVFM